MSLFISQCLLGFHLRIPAWLPIHGLYFPVHCDWDFPNYSVSYGGSQTMWTWLKNSTVKAKVGTLAVEELEFIVLEGIIKGRSGLATTSFDKTHLQRTIKLQVMVRAQCLHTSQQVGKISLNKPTFNFSLRTGIPIQYSLPPKSSLGQSLHWCLTKANKIEDWEVLLIFVSFPSSWGPQELWINGRI